MLEATANTSIKKLEMATKNFERLHISERKAKEQGPLMEMANAQKAELIKKDRM